MNTPEIEELKHLVEERYGKKLSTTTDFEEFSLMLQRRHEIGVSSSTLKRLYGYVGDSHTPPVCRHSMPSPPTLNSRTMQDL